MCIDTLWNCESPEDQSLTSLCTRYCSTMQEVTATSERELSVMLTTDAHIAELNLLWRKKTGPTDVLSFAMDEGELPPGIQGFEAPLGDIVISVDTAQRQAQEHQWQLADEISFLLVHGFCHLLGYDHMNAEDAHRMRAEETRLLAIIAPGLQRPPTAY